MGLWSTDGKTYEDWIRRLTSTIIRDEYAKYRKIMGNAKNGNENLPLNFFFSFYLSFRLNNCVMFLF